MYKISYIAYLYIIGASLEARPIVASTAESSATRYPSVRLSHGQFKLFTVTIAAIIEQTKTFNISTG